MIETATKTFTNMNATLETRKQELEAQIKILENQYISVIKNRNTEVNQLMEGYFTEAGLLEIHSCKYSSGSCAFNRENNSNELTIYFREGWGSEKENPIKDIEVSFYTTTIKNQFEFQRMVLIGKVGNLMLNKKEEILNNINKIYIRYNNELKLIEEKQLPLNREVREINSNIFESKKSNLLGAIFGNGVKVNHDYTWFMDLNNVKHVKAEYYKNGNGYSNKFATVTVEFWSKYSEEMKTVVFDKIKINRITEFITNNIHNLEVI